jgi:hypothetical protein
MFLLIFGNMSAQQEKGIVGTNNWLNNWTEFSPSRQDNGEATQILTGNIAKNTELSKKYTYLLLGSVFVTNNATLTIEPGTVIIGDYDSKASLTITNGSSIIANGLETDPIVFTSNRSVKKAGDWGGIIILGNGPTNKFGLGTAASFYTNLDPASYANANFGGDNIDNNSGILRYVRIEYAGKRTKTDSNSTALLLAGVGKKTILENIMISYSSGDSYTVWGGGINLTKAVSYRANGNDFKFNYGTQSELFNSIAVRSPYISSRNGSRCLQATSYEKREEVDFSKKGTSVVVKNVTLINDSQNLQNDIQMGLVKEAVYIGDNTKFNMNRSVISGFNPAVFLGDKIQVNYDNLVNIELTSMYFNNCNGNIFVEYNKNNEDLENWYGNTGFSNVYSKSDNSETFIDLNNEKRPDFRLRINKIMASKN